MEKFLDSAKIFYYERIKKPAPAVQDGILLQIRETSVKLQNAYTRFENESNEDLIDSIIYEIQSLRALYRYLIKQAKQNGIECTEISVFGKEVI